MIEILSIGSGLSLQDRGRAGWRRFGVPSGGAMDARSMNLANTLLGNPEDSTVLEIVRQGVRIRILEDTWLSIAGADFCSRLATGTAAPFSRGEILEFDQKAAGLYAYLAVPGGFKAQEWLGSRSSDLRNGMGHPIEKGTCLVAQQAQYRSPGSIARRLSSQPQSHIGGEKAHFDLYPGPQFDAFNSASRRQFIEGPWTVSMRSDRTGYHLEGPTLEVPASIPSEPVLAGSFQVPGGGQPIVTMTDGPTVGGYAKIAVFKAEDMDRFAQCAPGTQLSFSWVD